MRNLIEYDHLSIDGRMPGDAWWAGQQNAEVLTGDAVDAVAQLKEAGDGTLVMYGNGPFSRTLVEAGLLDELHLSISPFVAGSGESLAGHRQRRKGWT